MTHEDFTRESATGRPSDRSFGLVFAVAFALISLLPMRHGRPIHWTGIVIALGFLGTALFWPAVLAPLNRVWTSLGLFLHKITSPAILALLFYLVITPAAAVLRLLRKDLLHLQMDRGLGSYWTERRPPGPRAETMRQQF